ncbi:MAG TPA: MFS transporter, partial [Microbacteriaceae bacterium]|nr:MFS transporter [Microbacteriaceae bacterium]
MFGVGLILFGATSLTVRLSVSPEMLITLRAVQRLGGALLSTSAFSLPTVNFG